MSMVVQAVAYNSMQRCDSWQGSLLSACALLVCPTWSPFNALQPILMGLAPASTANCVCIAVSNCVCIVDGVETQCPDNVPNPPPPPPLLALQVIPAATKAQARDQLATLSKRVVEAAKVAAAANKERAVAEAVAAADEAVAAGGWCGLHAAGQRGRAGAVGNSL
jgi:hypothetical protein